MKAKDMPLKDLARVYFREVICKERKNVRLYEDIECESVNGKRKYLFDFLIEDPDNGDSIGVDVKDWGRVISVNVVMQFWRKIRNSGLTMGILVGSEFSGPAEDRAKAIENILLISRGVLVSYLRSMGLVE